MRVLSLFGTKKCVIAAALNFILLIAIGFSFSPAIQSSLYSLQTWNNCTSSYIAFDHREFDDNCYYYFGKNVTVNLNAGDSIRLNADVYQFVEGKIYDQRSLLNPLNIQEGAYAVLSENEIAIPSSVSSKYKLSLGDSLYLPGTKRFAVKYIYRDLYDMKNPSIGSSMSVVFIGGNAPIIEDYVYAGFGTESGLFNEVFTFEKAKQEFVMTTALNAGLISVASLAIQVGIIVLFWKQERKNLYKDCISGSRRNYYSSLFGVSLLLHIAPAVISSVIVAALGHWLSGVSLITIVVLATTAKVAQLYAKTH